MRHLRCGSPRGRIWRRRGTVEVACKRNRRDRGPRESWRGKGELEDRLTLAGEGMNASIPVHGASQEPSGSGRVNSQSTAQASTPAASPALTPVASVQPAATFQTVANPPDVPAPSQMPELPVDNGDEQAPGEGMRQWGLSIRAVSEDSARVACNFKGVGSVASYQLQGQTVGRDAQGMPAAVWKPFTNSTITVTGPVGDGRDGTFAAGGCSTWCGSPRWTPRGGSSRAPREGRYGR